MVRMQTLKYLVLIALCNFSFGDNIFYGKLNKLLDHCLVNREAVDSGVLLGIAFAKSQLLSDKGSFRTEVLLEKCETLALQFDNRNNIGKTTSLNLFIIFSILNFTARKFINSSISLKSFPLKFGTILKERNVFPSTDIYLQLLNDDRNQPNGRVSDKCLSQITNNCEISDFCWRMEDANAVAFGYSQTHRFELNLFRLSVIKISLN